MEKEFPKLQSAFRSFDKPKKRYEPKLTIVICVCEPSPTETSLQNGVTGKTTPHEVLPDSGYRRRPLEEKSIAGNCGGQGCDVRLPFRFLFAR